MTLYDFLVNQLADYVAESLKYLGDNMKFQEYIARAQACDDLIGILSDDTLRTEVTTRAQAIVKKENNL